MVPNHSQPAYRLSSDSHPAVDQGQESLIRTGIEMSNFIRSTLGPNGMDKLLVDSDGMVVVSNQGSTILGEMHTESNISPTGELFFSLANAHQKQLGDGATTSVVLAGELLREARGLINSGIHPTVIADGYQQAANKSRRTLEQIATHITTNDTNRLESVVKTSLCGLGSQSVTDALPHLLVDAGVELHTVGKSIEDLSIEKSIGGTLYDSVLMRGQMLLDNEPDVVGMPTEIAEATVVCIGADIEHSTEKKIKKQIDISDIGELETIKKHGEKALRKLVAQIREHSVGVVFVSGSIADPIRVALSDENILTVSQLTDEHLRKAARSTGASVLPELGKVREEAVGHAGLIEQQTVNGIQSIAIQDTPSTEELTLILRGEIEHLVDEAERGVKTACIVLDVLLETPYILPGGGAPEIAVAAQMRDEATSIDSKTQIVYEAYADAIETIPREIAKSSGLDPLTTVANMRTSYVERSNPLGIDAERGNLGNCFVNGTLDVLPIKQQVYEAAAGTAARLLRIDELLPANSLDNQIPNFDAN